MARGRPLALHLMLISLSVCFCSTLGFTTWTWTCPSYLTGRLPSHGDASLLRRSIVQSTAGDQRDHSDGRSSIGSIGDPILTNLLLTAARDNVNFGLEDISRASLGIQAWSAALRKGRLPVFSEFSSSSSSTSDTSDDIILIWPQEPLYSRFIDIMTDLQLPRFVLRHPETANAVLLSMLRLTIEFFERKTEDLDDENEGEEEEEDADDEYYNDSIHSEKDENMRTLLPQDNELMIAEDLAAELSSKWGSIVGGCTALDQLFGADHGLLDTVEREENEDEEEGDAIANAPFGFGLNDGVWSHSGWTLIPELQRRLASMQELRVLVNSLGKRPAAEGKELQKFPPQTRSPKSALGVEVDRLNRDSVRGIAFTGSLTEMLPSEAVMLKGSPALRRLFLAKKVESKLLGYEISGYSDVPSKPKTHRTYFKRLPSAPGGPIIICLDTSFSMTGDREVLAKAVVLECVKAAHEQKRDCTVVAFSSESNTLECGFFAADKTGIIRLLDFLSHSFSGGTDVTGALKHAMTILGADAMKSSDVILVSDGELQNPPVSDKVMKELDRLKDDTGMKIHGLLVGKRESEPLEVLCTKVYDFLEQYDALSALTESARNIGQ